MHEMLLFFSPSMAPFLLLGLQEIISKISLCKCISQDLVLYYLWNSSFLIFLLAAQKFSSYHLLMVTFSGHNKLDYPFQSSYYMICYFIVRCLSHEYGFLAYQNVNSFKSLIFFFNCSNH